MRADIFASNNPYSIITNTALEKACERSVGIPLRKDGKTVGYIKSATPNNEGKVSLEIQLAEGITEEDIQGIDPMRAISFSINTNKSCKRKKK